MHTAYQVDLNGKTVEYTLSEEESFHIVKVLRALPGSTLYLANGKGLRASATLLSTHHKRSVARVISFETQAVLPKKPIHLAIAPTKNNDRIEWLIEKATEIGMDEISLIKCKNNERNRINYERLEKIALSAFKQSKRLFLPKINPLVDILDFIESNQNGAIAHCYDEIEGANTKTEIGTKFIDGPILIGPEGDFTIDEVKKASEHNYQIISLGENRLRTETAGLFVICSQVMSRANQ